MMNSMVMALLRQAQGRPELPRSPLCPSMIDPAFRENPSMDPVAWSLAIKGHSSTLSLTARH